MCCMLHASPITLSKQDPSASRTRDDHLQRKERKQCKVMRVDMIGGLKIDQQFCEQEF